MRTFLLGVAVVIITIILMPFLKEDTGMQGVASAVASNENSCTADKIEIKEVTWKFVDPCRTRSCASLVGAGTLINHCDIPIGVRIKLTGRDGGGNLVAVKEGWPASVSNIAPAEYSFSIDTWLDYDPAIKSIEMSVSEVKQWQ